MKFKIGDNVKVVSGSFKGRSGVVSNVSGILVSFTRDITSITVYESELTLIKPKEKQSDKIRRIVREEMDKVEKGRWYVDPSVLDKSNENKECCFDSTASLNLSKEIQAMPIPFWGGEGTKCEPQQPKSGWYKSENNDKYITFNDFENECHYGVGLLGNWRKIDKPPCICDFETPATNEEVITRLVDYIKNNLHNK